MSEVEGFTNYATAGVAMTLDNCDRGSRHATSDRARAARDLAPTHQSVKDGIWTVEQAERFRLADTLKIYVEALCEQGQARTGSGLGALLVSQMVQAGLGEVDWNDLAEHYLRLLDDGEE